jgi:hypothetical protein
MNESVAQYDDGLQIVAALAGPNPRKGVQSMQIIRRALALAAVLGVFAATESQAQTIGFKLGPSFSTLSGDTDGFLEGTLTKFTGGGFIRFGMGGFAIQPELMYVTKGGKESFSEEGFSGDLELRLDYIEVPVLFVLPFAAGNISPFVYAGPAFSLEVGCKVAVSAGGFSGSEDCDDGDFDEGDFDRRKFDVGAMIGGGLAIPMGPGAVTLEGRYNFGLVNLNKGDDGTVRNRSAAVLVGYQVPIGPR